MISRSFITLTLICTGLSLLLDGCQHAETLPISSPEVVAYPYPAPGWPNLRPSSRPGYPGPPEPGPQVNAEQYAYPAPDQPLLPPTPTPNTAPPVSAVQDITFFAMLVNMHLEPLANSAGYRLADWPFGLRPSGYCETGPFQWLDDEHLLAFLVYGSEETTGRAIFSRPIVIDLKDGKIWSPVEPGSEFPGGDSLCEVEPKWSAVAEKLIFSNSGSTKVYDLNGRQLYESMAGGRGVSVSPSGEWLFPANGFYNLVTGERIEPSYPEGGTPYSLWEAWNQDESRVFGCCHLYAQRSDGTIRNLEPAGLWPLGMTIYPGQTGPLPVWTAAGDRVIYLSAFSQKNPEGENEIGPLPLINPDAGSYEDLRILAGLQPDDPCEMVAAVPDGRAGIANCGSGWYLFNLETDVAQRLEITGDFALQPSPNNAYFLLVGAPQESSWVVAADGSQVVELGKLLTTPTWHPQESWLVYPAADGTVLVVYEVETGKQHEYQPGRGQLSFAQAAVQWDTAGPGIVFQTVDGRSGWMPDLAAPTTYLLTPPYPGLRDLKISPHNHWLAFVHGSDLLVYPIPDR
jgi:hypothetical protein